MKKISKTDDVYLPPSALPQLTALAKAIVKYNDRRKREDWLVILPQALLSNDGHLKIQAVAVPADLAHALMALVEARFDTCAALTEELMKNYDNPLAEEVQP